MKPKAQVVGLKTLDVKAQALKPGQDFTSAAIRAWKKRVFTEDEWNFLNTLPTAELRNRIQTGHALIGILHRPEMMNMTPQLAAMVSSNLYFQIEAIQKIIDARPSDLDLANSRRQNNNG